MAWATYVTIIPDWWHLKTFKLVELPILYRIRLFCVSMIYMASSYAFERGVISGLLRPLTKLFSYQQWKKIYCMKCFGQSTKSHKAYKNLKATVAKRRIKYAAPSRFPEGASVTSEYYRLEE